MEASIRRVCWATKSLSQYKAFPFQIGKDVEVSDRELRQRFQIGTEEGPAEDLDVPPQGDGPEVDNCWFWFADGGYFSPDYPVHKSHSEILI